MPAKSQLPKPVHIEGLKALIRENSSRLLPEDDEKLRAMYSAMMEDDANLNRILVARKHDATQSTDLFFEQVRFRSKWNPKEIDPSAIATALPSGAWRICGYSKCGCPISNYKLEFWKPDAYEGDLDATIDEYTRYTCYMVELMIAKMKNQQQFMVIFDLRGFYSSMVFRRNIRLMIRKLIYVAQAQYPERLRKVMLVNSPYGFETAWSLIKPLLDEKTCGKISFACSDKLLHVVEKSVLSVEYGGDHPEYPIHSKRVTEEAML